MDEDNQTTEKLNNLLVLIHSEVAELELEPTQSESTKADLPTMGTVFFVIKILTCYSSFVQEGLRVNERSAHCIILKSPSLSKGKLVYSGTHLGISQSINIIQQYD